MSRQVSYVLIRKRKHESHAGPLQSEIDPSRKRTEIAELEVDAAEEGAHPVLGRNTSVWSAGSLSCSTLRFRAGRSERLGSPRGCIRKRRVAVMAATPGRSAWRASACRFACPGFAMSRGARCRCGRMRRCMGSARSMYLLLTRVLYGISCRNYEAAAEAIPGAIGLSGSTVSRTFIQASATKLRELQERDLSGEDVVSDGAGREDVRRVDDGRRAGDHVDGGETVPGVRRDGHRRTRRS